MDPGRIYPEVACEKARRLTSNVPANTTEVNMEVVVRRVSLLLNKPEGYVQPVLDIFHRVGIRSYVSLHIRLAETHGNREQTARFTTLFERASTDGFCLSFQELQYYRCCSMYLNSRCTIDHEYFQQMIE